MELKLVLSRLSWFAGARMHATIGAFSSGTPTLGLGYSDKAAGVFAQCGLAHHVADLRQRDATALADIVRFSYAAREMNRFALRDIVPDLQDRAEAQMDAIVRQIRG
jgi:polysaccharide pyruvyl transferase WcaK-like protein